MLGDGGAGSYLGAVGQSCPGLVLAVGAALAQQDASVAFDEPDNLPGCHQYSLATNHFKCLALNTMVEQCSDGVYGCLNVSQRPPVSVRHKATGYDAGRHVSDRHAARRERMTATCASATIAG